MNDSALCTGQLKVTEADLTVLTENGLVLLPDQLSEEACQILLAEAQALDIEDPDPARRHGPRKIREEVVFAPPTGMLAHFAQVYALYFRKRIGMEIEMNEHLVWRFPEWSVGIEPHFEYSRIVSLQALICLSGGITYHLEGPDRHCNLQPGDILLRAFPGFGQTARRKHVVTGVEGETFLISLRQTSIGGTK